MSNAAAPKSDNKFRHHRGGVVQIYHEYRFGMVPEALLEDSRLDLDARAVAAWLAIKQHGWQISISVLRNRLSQDGKILSKERWKRIAEQLEAAEYLSRRKINGAGGLWTWEIIFTPVSRSFTMDGFSTHGSATPGRAADGPAVSGERVHNVVPRRKQSTKNITTTKDTIQQPDEVGHSQKVELNDQCELLTYPDVTSAEVVELQRLVLECRADARQDVLDELEGYRRFGKLRSGIVGLARTLVTKANEGGFSLVKGHAVQAERARRLQNEAAVARSKVTLVTAEPSAELMEKLFPKRAQQMREELKESRGIS